MRTTAPRKKLRPGDLAPITGIYLIHHGVRHRDAHDVVIIRGEPLPACRTCKLNVSFDVVRPVSHITHDWDFSGPYNLVVKPSPEGLQDFRMYRRANLELPVRLELSNGQIIHGYSSDLSAGGVGTVIRSPLPAAYKSEAARINIGSGRDSLSVMARLCYQSGVRHGFEFLNVSPTEREAIRRIIMRRRTSAVALSG